MRNTQKSNPKVLSHAFHEHSPDRGKNLEEFISKSQHPQKLLTKQGNTPQISPQNAQEMK